jgi:hypothetical protein
MERGLFAPVHFDQLMKLDEWTPDGRFIAAAGFGTRNMPRPIYFLGEIGPGGHLGAKIAGRLDNVSVDHATNIVSGDGWLLDNAAGRECALCLDTKAIHGNSVDLADVEMEFVERDTGNPDVFDIGMRFNRANLGATTVVGIPAFPEASAGLDELVRTGSFAGLNQPSDLPELLSGLGHDLRSVGSFSATTLGTAAPAAPQLFTTDVPMAWFSGEEPRKPYPLTVEANGRVHGYLADWKHDHLSVQGKVRAPRGRGYSYFNCSTVLTPDGPVQTGPLVIGGDHFGKGSWTDAKDHYAATSLAWADVHVTDDRLGIRVNGMVRPGISNDVVHAGRASRLSGDWRRIKGALELVASLSVNNPAFPIARDFSSSEVDGSLTLFAPDFTDGGVEEARLLAARRRIVLGRLGLAAMQDVQDGVHLS